MTRRPFLLGAVAYDPKVVTIWEGFRALVRRAAASTSTSSCTRNYERQVERPGRGPDRRGVELAAGLGARRAPGRGRGHGRCAPRVDARHRPRPHVGRGGARGLRDRVGSRDLTGRTVARRGGRLAAGDAASRCATCGRWGCGPARRHGPALRRGRRPARRPHRRRARRGPRAAGGRGRRRLHDRRQPPAVHPGGHAARGRRRIVAQTRAVRPLQHDGRRHRAGRRSRRGSPSCCSAMSYADPEVRPLLDLEGLKAWRDGPHERLRAARARGRRGRLLRRRRAGDRRGRTRRDRRRPRPGGARVRPRARTCSSTGRCAVLPPGGRARVRRRATRRWASTCAPGAGPAGHEFAERPDGRLRPSVAGRPSGSGGRGAERAGAAGRRRRWSGARPRTGASAARGALVEAGGPAASSFDLDDRDDGVGRPRAAALRPGRRRAVGPRHRGRLGRTRSTLPAEIEAAVVQVMTYLVENEQAALVVPARFLARVHPHFREVHAAARRAGGRRGPPRRGVHPPARLLHGAELGTSSVGGRGVAARRCWPSRTSRWPRSCCRCWARAASSTCCRSSSEHAPDPVTRQVARLRAPGRGPPRRVRHRPPRAPGALDPRCREHAARGDRAPSRRARRHRRAQRRRLRRARRPRRRGVDARRDRPRLRAPSSDLDHAMDDGRRRRLVRLGFPPDEAADAVRAAHPQLHVRSLNSFRIGTRLRHISTASSRRGVA